MSIARHIIHIIVDFVVDNRKIRLTPHIGLMIAFWMGDFKSDLRRISGGPPMAQVEAINF